MFMTFGKQNQKEDGIQKHLKIIIIIFQTPSTFHIQRIPQRVTGSTQQFITNILNRGITEVLFLGRVHDHILQRCQLLEIWNLEIFLLKHPGIELPPSDVGPGN